MNLMPEEISSISLNITNNNFVKNSKYKKPAIILGGVLFAVILAIISIYYFSIPNSYINPFDVKNPGQENKDSSESSNKFENPINGVLIDQDKAQSFKDRKPIAVMLNNYVDARPSAGISSADIVYEAVAEGGITRLMPIYFSEIPEKVRSVRSARYYFAELASAYHPHFIHWGAAHVPVCQKASPSSSTYCPPVNGKVETLPIADAYDRIVKLGLPNLDGGNYSCEASTCAFGRDPEKLGKLPLEHTAFTRLPLIYELAQKIRPEESWHKFTPFNSWEFKEDASDSERGDIGLSMPIKYNYWDTMAGFDVKWEYDKASNSYLRYQGGVKIVDDLNQKAVMAKDIIIRYTEQVSAGDKKNHNIFTITGKGNALIFMDGKVIKATWERSTHEEMDVYKDLNGEEIKFNRGQIWVQLLPTENIVSYEPPAKVPAT